MRERPILFSAPMVRAILEGRKTVTRRVVKTREPISFLGEGEENNLSCWGWFFDGADQHGYMVLERGHNSREDHGLVSIPCPFGDRGDRFWVRETWGLHRPFDITDWHRGRVDGDMRDEFEVDYRADWAHEYEHCFWRPSIHMPRWASRITLEVIGARVERLHDITEEDAKAEGVDGRAEFERLWAEINGPDAWAESPFVWRIEFRVSAAGRGRV